MMDNVRVSHSDGVHVVAISRGKVNALNDRVVDELQRVFESLADDSAVAAAVLTGSEKFFSFGWDVPEFLDWERPKFERFLAAFTDLYRAIFTFPKPIVCAINGHAMAGGCMLASACDERIMAPGKAKMSFNEVTFGSAVPAGSVDMVSYWVGDAKAERLMLSGVMLTPEEALAVNLVDEVVDAENLLSRAQERALQLAQPDAAAYALVKAMMRGPVATRMKARDAEFNTRFAELWYSENTRRQLQGIAIR